MLEFKLGSSEIERLIKEYNEKEKQMPLRLPDLKIVITGTEYGYRREDGVFCHSYWLSKRLAIPFNSHSITIRPLLISTPFFNFIQIILLLTTTTNDKSTNNYKDKI